MSVCRGSTKSSSRRGAASRAALAALSGTCSPRTTLSGSHRWSVSRGGGGLLVGLASGSPAPGCFRTVSPHFHVQVYSGPEVVSVHRCCFSRSLEPVTLGNWTLRSRAPRIWQFLFAVWVYVLFMSQCLVQQWIHVTRQPLVLLDGFLREGELAS